MYALSLLMTETRTARSSLVDLSITTKPTAIGRKNADVIVEDERCSRLHAELFIHEGRVCIRDLQSSNGTYVDGKKVDLKTLKVGSKIKIGGTKLQITRMESVESTNPRRPDGQVWSDGFPLID